MSNTSLCNNILRLLAGSALALTLAACESSGGIRTAGVGSASAEAPPAGSASASNDVNGSAGVGDDSGGSDSADAGGGMPRIRNVPNAAGGAAQGSNGFGAPLLVTAGNALLDVADRGVTVRGPLSDNLPNSAPITGSVTQLLASTGQALVRGADGSSYLVDGLRAAPGSVVTIGVGQGTSLGGPGSNPLLGVNVLAPTQTSGSLATLNAAAGGNLLSATVPNDGALATTPGAVTGATSGLVNATAGGSQVLGSGPSAIGASVLSPTQTTGSVLTAGVGSGGQAVTLNGTTVAAPTTGGSLLGGAGALGGQPVTLGGTTVTPPTTGGNLVGGASTLGGVTGAAGATGNGAVTVGPLTLGR